MVMNWILNVGSLPGISLDPKRLAVRAMPSDWLTKIQPKFDAGFAAQAWTSATKPCVEVNVKVPSPGIGLEALAVTG